MSPKWALQGVLVEYTPTLYSVASGHNLLCHINDNILSFKNQVFIKNFTFLHTKSVNH